MVQLREKEASSRDFLALTRLLVRELHGRGVPLVVNDRADIALAGGAAGLHVGQSDLPPADARALMGPDALIGLSVENMAQLEAAQTWDVDYLGISPVWATPTKTDTAEPWGLDGLAEAGKRSRLPLVAIGGIHAGNAAEVIAAGSGRSGRGVGNLLRAGPGSGGALSAGAVPEHSAFQTFRRISTRQRMTAGHHRGGHVRRGQAVPHAVKPEPAGQKQQAGNKEQHLPRQGEEAGHSHQPYGLKVGGNHNLPPDDEERRRTGPQGMDGKRQQIGMIREHAGQRFRRELKVKPAQRRDGRARRHAHPQRAPHAIRTPRAEVVADDGCMPCVSPMTTMPNSMTSRFRMP